MSPRCVLLAVSAAVALLLACAVVTAADATADADGSTDSAPGPIQSKAATKLSAAVGLGRVRVIDAGTRGANGWYTAVPASTVTEGMARRYSSTRVHPHYIRVDGDDEYRITYRTVNQRVMDAHGTPHDLVGQAGQWVLYLTPGDAGPNKSPLFLYAVTASWPVPPAVGWMAVRGRRPLPRVEVSPPPHLCDRAALDLEQCGTDMDPKKCADDATAAVLACVRQNRWSIAGSAHADVDDSLARGDREVTPFRPPLPRALLQDQPGTDAPAAAFFATGVDGDDAADGAEDGVGGQSQYGQSAVAVDARGPSSVQTGTPRRAQGTGPDAGGADADSLPPFKFDSAVACGEAPVYPHRQPARWCHCTNCAVRRGRVLFFRPNATYRKPSSLMAPAASHYLHDYFHTSNDHVFASVVPRKALKGVECDTVVDEPSFFFAARRLHNMYNLLAEALLPLHNAMLRTYGEVRPDARLWVQHDGLDSQQTARSSDALELEVAHATGAHGVAGAGSAPLALLRLFSRHAIQTRADWDDALEQRGTVCFRSLHVGLDMRGTFFHAGASAAQPQHAVVDTRSAQGEAMAAQQSQLVSTLLDGLGLPPRATLPKLSVAGGEAAYVERVVVNVVGVSGSASGVGGIRDVDAVLAAVARAPGLPPSAVSEAHALASRSIHDVAELMSRTSVFVTTPDGISAAVALMPRGSVVVLVTEPGLNGWKWMHANLALLSGVHVVAVQRCAEDDDDCGDTQGFGGVADHTQVEPRAGGSDDDEEFAAVEVDSVEQAIAEAVALRRGDYDTHSAGVFLRTVPDVCEDEYAGMDAGDGDVPWFCHPVDAGGAGSSAW